MLVAYANANYTIIMHGRAQTSLLVNPNPNLTPPNIPVVQLHDTAAALCPILYPQAQCFSMDTDHNRF